MKFCNNCSNKLYVYEKNGTLIYKCNDCGEEYENKDFIIKQKNYNESLSMLDNIQVKQNLKYDNSLKRSKKYKCKNCNDNTEVIIIVNNVLENIYICSNCSSEWKYS